MEYWTRRLCKLRPHCPSHKNCGLCTPRIIRDLLEKHGFTDSFEKQHETYLENIVLDALVGELQLFDLKAKIDRKIDYNMIKLDNISTALDKLGL